VHPPLRTLFLLVDGLGLGGSDPADNPVRSGRCPHLQGFMDQAAPVDAGLGVPGIPQSATGQTALFTGINAAAAMGRHVEGFPGAELRRIIRAHNLYDRLADLGFRSTFANAYYVTDLGDVPQRRLQSVTTVAALKAFGGVRDLPAMLRNDAVYQDLTRESLRARGYGGPLVTPAESARHLMAIAGRYDFTVFEYFQTDRAGHKGSREDVLRVLGLLDEFMAELRSFPETPGHLLILTSDHGNIEAGGTPRHTANPVPFLALGEGAEILRASVRSIVDVAPAIIALYASRGAPAGPRGLEDQPAADGFPLTEQA
jgi:2,3-bisphosphoglycerate-independent phosphoglycerate mutase